MPNIKRHNSLDEQALNKIKQAKSQLDLVLSAVEKAPKPAVLKAQELDIIKALEKATGKILMAYQH